MTQANAAPGIKALLALPRWAPAILSVTIGFNSLFVALCDPYPEVKAAAALIGAVTWCVALVGGRAS